VFSARKQETTAGEIYDHTLSRSRSISLGAGRLDKVFLEVFPTIRPGDSERDVHSRIIAGCIRAGFGWAHGILNSHRNPAIYCGESDFAFRSGDIVRTRFSAEAIARRWSRAWSLPSSPSSIIGTCRIWCS
jgi:hypothetical protein